ncbi:hypothetical protein BOTBODRAFT_51496 [Botryobasidium botryosum FD-172 SS1]|uniref:RRM domain-containing protein n=1 Tax=Botryobasidium botryosum (strain FD-172 SS1) TaxID=930990 RepID=A0A067N8P2_BOTB1|nr:hypothetical protein BOTBODRAFT_51496 [Botryobasidium botryosum FD-172 SS1]
MRSVIHITGKRGALERVSDIEIYVVFDPYGKVTAIRRWRNEKSDALHLFVDFATMDDAVAALQYRGPEFWQISLLATKPEFYNVYRKIKARPQASAQYPVLATPSSGSSSARDIQSRSVFTPHSTPLTPPDSEAKGVSNSREIGYPFGHTSAQTPCQQPCPSSRLDELAPASSGSSVRVPMSLDHTHTNADERITLPYPTNSAVKRMFELDPEEERKPEYTPTRESRRRRRSQSIGRGQVESIELVQERSRCSELESRTQDAEDKLAIMQERVEQLAVEKQVLEREATERAAQGAKLMERCETLERQLAEANAREVRAREELASEKAARDVEMEARCELLEGLVQAEEARIAAFEKAENGRVERVVWEAEMTQRCEALERDWEEARAKEGEEREMRECLSAQQIAEEAGLRRRCERLEMELAKSLGGLVEAERDREQLKRMVDGAFIVPALQRAFLQIDGLLKELVETTPT